MYDLPSFNVKIPGFLKNKIFWGVVLVIFISSLFGFLAGAIYYNYFSSGGKSYAPKLDMGIFGNKFSDQQAVYLPQTSQEDAIISVVNGVSPAVVSIIVTKDVPIIEQYYTNPFQDFGDFFGSDFLVPQYRQNGTEKKEVGGGTGFIVSEDGMILTNKHVVSDAEADYTVLTNDGKKYSAEVLARDPIQDLAVIKIDSNRAIDSKGEMVLKQFPTVPLGDSDRIQIGQTVIAIGNTLGEFRNTVSVGVVSGLGRTITVSDGSVTETLEDVIQTDAAINSGNSGGPLLNLKGEVIGINTAMVQGAQSIGFTIPINKAKKDIDNVKSSGRIIYPLLGIRYVLINATIQQNNNLKVDYGALVQKGENGEEAISPGSAAEKAGLTEGDIILEINGEKITTENTLSEIVMKYNPGDKVVLKILRGGEEKTLEATLTERAQ
ncbi:MAG: trypsin-like peptidase domain-containing protein [Candidatus Paceibacterota bacterium]